MARRSSPRSDNMRRLVAHEAARLMSEQGLDDYFLAKRKAADRLGLSDQASLPRNSEIEAALVERQRLFDVQTHEERVRQYRQAAHNALLFFSVFNPRVAGTVLSGAVALGSDLEIHLFADTVELVTLRLAENDMPYRLVERRMRVSGSEYARFPACRFIADDVPVLAVLFPVDGVRQAPFCPVNGRPMRRADLRELEALIEQDKVREKMEQMGSE